MKRAPVLALTICVFFVASSAFAARTNVSVSRHSAVEITTANAVAVGTAEALMSTQDRQSGLFQLAADQTTPNPCSQPNEAPRARGQSGNKRRYVNPMTPCGPSGDPRNPHARRG